MKENLKILINSILKEELKIINEAAKTIESIPDEYKIHIGRGLLSGDKDIELKNDQDNTLGSISLSRPKNADGPCLSAYIIFSSRATSGFGPLLYDIALEYAGSSGIAPDRLLVSSDASSVWKYYHDNRGDVRKELLDNIIDPKTPQEEDDCSFKSSGNEEDKIERPWLNYVYYKDSQDNINKLRSLGKLVEE